MILERFTKQLAGNAQCIRALTRDITDLQAHWKPDENSWSVVEVINHLYDEERLDFRVRIEYTLDKVGEEWPAIDPEGWVQEHSYSERELRVSLADLHAERQASLAWLKGLPNPDWELSYQAPFGAIKAGDVLAAWVAHDLLHTRQIVELHWAYMLEQVQPYSVRYAGEW